MSGELVRLGAAEAIGRLKRGDVSAGELFDAYLERIEKLDSKIGSYLWVAPEPAVRGRGPLLGIHLVHGWRRRSFACAGQRPRAARLEYRGWVPPRVSSAESEEPGDSSRSHPVRCLSVCSADGQPRISRKQSLQ